VIKLAQELITAIDLLSRIGEVKPFEILDELVFPRYASHGAGAERSLLAHRTSNRHLKTGNFGRSCDVDDRGLLEQEMKISSPGTHVPCASAASSRQSCRIDGKDFEDAFFLPRRPAVPACSFGAVVEEV
jgi:hypothetical protein